jgi:hypothetical protein
MTNKEISELGRIIEAGAAAGETDKRLVAAVVQATQEIARTVPDEWIENRDLSLGYRVYFQGSGRVLKKTIGSRPNDRIVFDSNITVEQARAFAFDVEGQQFFTNLLLMIESYRNSSARLLGAVEAGVESLRST